MKFRNNCFNILYLVGSLVSILWYFCLGSAVMRFLIYNCNFFTMTFDYSWFRYIFYFVPPIILTFLPRIFKCIRCIRQGHDTKQFKELNLDLINSFAILVNVSAFINNAFSKEIASIIHPISALLFFVYIFHLLIREAWGISYFNAFIIFLSVIILGWFNFQEISLIAILSIILNTAISIDQRKGLFSFLEKREIGNQFLRKLSAKDDLTDDELTGKFLAQKIVFYGLIAIFYIITKITDSISIVAYVFSFFSSNENIVFPELMAFLYKGYDRILWLSAFLLLVYFKKNWRESLAKIF